MLRIRIPSLFSFQKCLNTRNLNLKIVQEIMLNFEMSSVMKIQYSSYQMNLIFSTLQIKNVFVKVILYIQQDEEIGLSAVCI